jgi:antitoxin (DNA-binding transcriptional repressor) of toxin-antitoxin stability system
MVDIDGPHALKELTELVDAGEDVTLTRNGQKFAEVVATPPSSNGSSLLGALKGKLPDDLVVPKWIVEDDKIVVKYPKF